MTGERQPGDLESGGQRNGAALRQAAPGDPLVTVVTVVYNGERFLEQTILSVLSQTYPRIEYIVIDGGSTDRTLDIIRRYERHIAYWVSERDKGISDAFNKGILASQGDMVQMLNADDWLSPDQIERAVLGLKDCPCDFVFGDLVFHDVEGVARYVIRGDPDYARVIRQKMPELCHPTVLVKKATYERIGLFNTRYRYAMDYEWLLRLHLAGGRGRYVPRLVGHMRVGGASDASFSKALSEVRDIAIHYGQPRFWAYSHFFFRLIKGAVRRQLEKWFPQRAYHRIRNVVNPRYRGHAPTC
jgi:glycosyltransferase involved in cell wall biosynthesis